MAKSIEVALKLDNGKFNREIKQSQNQVKKLGTDGSKSINGLRTAFAGLFAAISVREITSLADQFTNLNNRLKAVTTSQAEASNALKLVNQVAGETRSDISAVASLFADLTVATKDLGTSQEEIAQVTKVFSQTLQISGADAGAAAGAIRQFGQALASGVLRGDEFNSIAETNSFFMLKFADAIGKPLGELRKLAAEGVLTADIILQATRKMASEVDADFSQTVATVGQSFNVLRTSFVNLFGRIEADTGVFENLSASIIKLADSINGVTTSKLFEGLENLAYIGGILLVTFGSRGLLKLLNGVSKNFIKLGVIVGGTATTLTSFSRISAAVKSGLSGLMAIFTGAAMGGRIGALGKVIANIGRIFVRFLGPIGAVIGALELLSFASKKLGGPDFMAPAREKIKGFTADLLGLEQQAEETAEAIDPNNLIPGSQAHSDYYNLFMDPPSPDMGEDDTDTPIKLPTKQLSALEKFRKLVDSSSPDLETYKELLKEIDATFSDQSTIAAMEERASAIDDLTNSYSHLFDPLEEFNDLIDMGVDTQAEYNTLQKELNRLIELGIFNIEDLAEAQKNLDDAFGENEGLQSFINTLNQATDTLADDLATAMIEGKSAMDSFKGFFKTLVTQIIADALKLLLIIPILEAIGFTTTGGSITGLSGGGFLGLFKQTGIGGGNLMANRPVLVGESGPEIFYPANSGSLQPNGMGTNVTYNINAVDAPSFQQLVAQDPEFIYAVTRAGSRRLPGVS